MYKNIFIIAFLISNSSHTMQQNDQLSTIDEKSIYLARKIGNKVLTHYCCTVVDCRYTHGKSKVIENHIKLHNSLNNRDYLVKSKFYSCTVCDFLSVKKQVFKRHTHSHSDKKYHCNKCSKELKYPDSLKRHKEIQHSKQKNSLIQK